MSGLIRVNAFGSKSGLIRRNPVESDLVYTNYMTSPQTIDTGGEAITQLNRTYTYRAPHYLWVCGGLTMTAGGAFHSHVGIFLDGASIGHPDQHFTPQGNWWYMSWSFVSENVVTAGQHAVTYTGDPQHINWNIIGDHANSQAILRIIPV